MTEKRKQLEEALGRYHREIDDVCGFKVAPGLDYKALAENKDVIVIECEVEHIESPAGDATRIRYRHDNRYYEGMLLDELHGKPGKYFFIGLPLEEAG